MNQPTNPNAGVAPSTPEDRVAAILTLDEQPEEAAQPEVKAEVAPQATEQEVAEQPESDVAEGEPVEEVAEAPEDAVGTFEIVHNGTQVALTREEAIKYAQQGFDVTRKYQAVAEQDRIAKARLSAIQQVEQVQPMLAEEQAVVKALESQLAQYRNVNWVQVAKDDPFGYPALRAQFDDLREAHNRAAYTFEQKKNAVNAQMVEIRKSFLQDEAKKLPELIPEWRDAKKKEAGQKELYDYLSSRGFSQEALDNLSDAMSVSIAWKAMQYDKLKQGKDAKVGQLKKLPPVAQPGAARVASAKADKDTELRKKLRKTGSMEDATALILNRL